MNPHSRILLTILTALITGTALHAQTLMIRSDVIANSSTVYLRDMLEDTTRVPASWLNRKVLSAPPSLGTKEYELTAIAYMLQQYPDMNKASLSGMGTVQVRRAKRLLTQEELHHAVEDYIAYMQSSEYEYRVDFNRFRRKVWIPTGQTEFQIRQSRSSAADRFSNTYIADVYVEDEKVCAIPLSAAIVELHDIWVAHDLLPQGHIIKDSDLVAQKMQLVERGKHRIPSSELIVGQELSRTLQRGDPILKTYLRSPLCARKGDSITVIAKTGSMSITVKAKALSTGRLGERILCKNQRSNRQFLVELTGINRAKLARL